MSGAPFTIPVPVVASDWLAWRGGERPLTKDTLVEVELRDGSRTTRAAGALAWMHVANCAASDVVAYRIVSPARLSDDEYDRREQNPKGWPVRQDVEKPDFAGMVSAIEASIARDERPHGHYYKSVKHLDTIDVYRVLSLFNVYDPCLQHAIKKLLVAGGRGAGKDSSKDVQEAIDSLTRWQAMRAEDVRGAT